jgi:hypothetical protein
MRKAKPHALGQASRRTVRTAKIILVIDRVAIRPMEYVAQGVCRRRHTLQGSNAHHHAAVEKELLDHRPVAIVADRLGQMHQTPSTAQAVMRARLGASVLIPSLR